MKEQKEIKVNKLELHLGTFKNKPSEKNQAAAEDCTAQWGNSVWVMTKKCIVKSEAGGLDWQLSTRNRGKTGASVGPGALW